MPFIAEPLASIVRSRRDTTKHVLFLRYRLKVVWINATPDPTQMIYLKPDWLAAICGQIAYNVPSSNAALGPLYMDSSVST